jgi:hypothetical protein
MTKCIAKNPQGGDHLFEDESLVPEGYTNVRQLDDQGRPMAQDEGETPQNPDRTGTQAQDPPTGEGTPTPDGGTAEAEEPPQGDSGPTPQGDASGSDVGQPAGDAPDPLAEHAGGPVE